MAYKRKPKPIEEPVKEVTDVPIDPVITEGNETVVESVIEPVEDVMTIGDEASVEIALEPKPAISGSMQEEIERLKIKLIDGTITDGEAAEYRTLLGN